MFVLRLRWTTVFVLLATVCCVHNELPIRHSANNPVDVIVIPGCPTTDEGGLSRCLLQRVAWGAHLWRTGMGRAFITSGAAAHTPFVEAEAMAAGLVALGVPADRIWLEPHARHTDENMFYALRIARELGFDSLAVASHGGHAAGACSFVESWGGSCVIAAMDREAVQGVLGSTDSAALAPVRVPRVSDWVPVRVYERRRLAMGGPDRPGSILVYFFLAPLSRLLGQPYEPAPSPARSLLRYDARR